MLAAREPIAATLSKSPMPFGLITSDIGTGSRKVKHSRFPNRDMRLPVGSSRMWITAGESEGGNPGV